MPKTRLEAFSDSIIAFAITLLVLEIHVPDLPRAASNGEMLRAIGALLPNFAVYLISFAVCAVWWVSHHGLIHDVEQVDRPLLWANSLFLMLIAFLPFPTGLLGHHPRQAVAAALYGVVCALTGISFWLMRWYASIPGRLMKPSIDAALLRRRVRISMLSPCCYLLGAATSAVSTMAAMIIYAAVPCFFAVTTLSGGTKTGDEKSVD
jgi:uncharacterized membrane protein